MGSPRRAGVGYTLRQVGREEGEGEVATILLDTASRRQCTHLLKRGHRERQLWYCSDL